MLYTDVYWLMSPYMRNIYHAGPRTQIYNPAFPNGEMRLQILDQPGLPNKTVYKIKSAVFFLRKCVIIMRIK